MSRPVFSEFTGNPARLRQLVLFALLVLIMQFSDPIGSASLQDATVFWVGRLVAVLLSFAIADWLLSRVFADRWLAPVWLKPAVLFAVVAVLPMTVAELTLESLVPQLEAFDDSVLLEQSPTLAFLGEYLTILTVILPLNIVLWIAIDQRKAAHEQIRDSADDIGRPAFLEKTQGIKLQDVIALAAEEHYVRVLTMEGSEMIYARFRDVIAQMPPSVGLQVHRSWWVADKGVVGARRGARRYELKLSDGTIVPVSDSFTRVVRKRGLLRRR